MQAEYGLSCMGDYIASRLAHVVVQMIDVCLD